MTFKFLSIFHDFPGKFIFPGFSMIFHDRGNPGKIDTDLPGFLFRKMLGTRYGSVRTQFF